MGSSAIGARIEARGDRVWGGGVPLPTSRVVLGGGCVPPQLVSWSLASLFSTNTAIMFRFFELKKASFGAFWMLFLQLN